MYLTSTTYCAKVPTVSGVAPNAALSYVVASTAAQGNDKKSDSLVRGHLCLKTRILRLSDTPRTLGGGTRPTAPSFFSNLGSEGLLKKSATSCYPRNITRF